MVFREKCRTKSSEGHLGTTEKEQLWGRVRGTQGGTEVNTPHQDPRLPEGWGADFWLLFTPSQSTWHPGRGRGGTLREPAGDTLGPGARLGRGLLGTRGPSWTGPALIPAGSLS